MFIKDNMALDSPNNMAIDTRRIQWNLPMSEDFSRNPLYTEGGD